MKRNVEYLIVGQGLAGTLLAFEMLNKNIDFRIISSSEKSKASMVAAGMVNPLVFKRLTKSWMVDDLLPVMHETFEKLEDQLGKQFYFKKDIIKPLSEQEKQLWLERKENQDFAKYIVSVKDSIETEYLIEAGAYGQVSQSGYLNLKSFLDASEIFFKQNELIIDSTFNNKAINSNADSFLIENYNASKIVFCEGYHMAQNPLFNFVKLNPTKGELLVIESSDLSEEFIFNKNVFVLPIGKQLFKVGSTYEWKDLSEKTTVKGKDSIIERFESLVKATYTIKEHIAGVRPTVSDRRPILGIHPEYRNISVLNGLGTKGVMLAPYFAKEMINVLMSDNYKVNAEVDLNRFWT